MRPTTPVIRVEHLRKVYSGAEDHVAVADLSFTLDRGQSLGIVGESGAGKTTVASMLMGFEQPTGGTIALDGAPATAAHKAADRRKRARKIQMVFQDPYSSLDPHQSIGSAIDEILRFHFAHSAPARSARVNELLDQVGLSGDLTAALPRALSGGQRQRVAIARALATEPDILILDESVAALDVSIQAQVLNLLNDLRHQLDMTYIFISHDLGVIRYTTDHVIVMRHGQVVETGPTSRTLDHPASAYTQELLASVPRPGWKPERSVPAAQTSLTPG